MSKAGYRKEQKRNRDRDREGVRDREKEGNLSGKEVKAYTVKTHRDSRRINSLYSLSSGRLYCWVMAAWSSYTFSKCHKPTCQAKHRSETL